MERHELLKDLPTAKAGDMKKPTTFEEAEAYTKALFEKDHRPFVMAPDFWLNSQLSVAKYYGGCVYNGVKYVVVPTTGDLVRFDCVDIYHKFYEKNRPHYDADGNKIEAKPST